MNSHSRRRRSKNLDETSGVTALEASPSAGWQEVGEAMHVEVGLGEYIEENRDDLEILAKADYPVSPVIRALIDQKDRGVIEC